MKKKIRIFGYGSLINETSLKKTVPSATNIFPAKTFGFLRIFNAKCNRLCSIKKTPVAALNIEKSEINHEINGICFDMDSKDFKALEEREKDYELIQIDVYDYNNKNNIFKAYTFRVPHFEAKFTYLHNSDQQKEYLNICIQGCKQFGNKFLKEFKQTTYIERKTIEELEKENKIYL